MFTPVSSRAANANRQVGVQSSIDGASPHQLVQMLFDGLLQTLHEARGALQRGEVEAKGRLLGKAVRILEEGLITALDLEQGGEVALNLNAVYDYALRRLIQANVENSDALLQEVARVIEPIAQGWKAIKKSDQATADNASQPMLAEV